MHIKFGVIFRFHYALAQSVQGCTCFLFMDINTENYTSLNISYMLTMVQQTEELLNTVAENTKETLALSWKLVVGFCSHAENGLSSETYPLCSCAHTQVCKRTRGQCCPFILKHSGTYSIFYSIKTKQTKNLHIYKKLEWASICGWCLKNHNSFKTAAKIYSGDLLEKSHSYISREELFYPSWDDQRENTHDHTFGIGPPQKMMFIEISFLKIQWHKFLF